MTRRCLSIVPDRFEDRRSRAMEDGLRRLGFHVFFDEGLLKPGDHLLTWNIHGDQRQHLAAKIKFAGGKVLVAEEGYTRGMTEHKHFALAVNGHNGAGFTPSGGPERFARLGIELRPWKTDGEHILVAGQRGIGSKDMASPPDWHNDAAKRLRSLTKRHILIRPHPGKDKLSAPPIEGQLEKAWAVVVWSSSVAVKALAFGIPVFFEAPSVSVKRACWRFIREIEQPLRSDYLREQAMVDMSWMQWTLEELSSGEAFARVLEL